MYARKVLFCAFKNILTDSRLNSERQKVMILSYSDYCRYRAMLSRVNNNTESWFASDVAVALGMVVVNGLKAYIMFCRDTFDHDGLFCNDLNYEHLDSVQKNKSRKKHIKMQRSASLDEESNSSDDSNDDYRKVKTSPNGVQSVAHKDEQLFLQKLFKFMKNRKTPIHRVPHLGFKQINLFILYKKAQKYGGYDQITCKKLWKNIYDSMGGDPGSTSAATCTRKHYERLLLPFERHLRGEDDKAVENATTSKCKIKNSFPEIKPINLIQNDMPVNNEESLIKSEITGNSENVDIDVETQDIMPECQNMIEEISKEENVILVNQQTNEDTILKIRLQKLPVEQHGKVKSLWQQKIMSPKKVMTDMISDKECQWNEIRKKNVLARSWARQQKTPSSTVEDVIEIPLNQPTNEEVNPLMNQTENPTISFMNQTENPTIPFMNQTENPTIPFMNQTENPTIPFMNQTENPNIPFINQTENPTIPFMNQTENPTIPFMNQTENPTIPFMNQTENPTIPFMNQTENPTIPFINQTENPTIPFVNQTENLTIPFMKQTENPTIPFMKQTENPINPFMKQIENPTIPFMNETDNPTIPFMNSEKSVVYPKTAEVATITKSSPAIIAQHVQNTTDSPTLGVTGIKSSVEDKGSYTLHRLLTEYSINHDKYPISSSCPLPVCSANANVTGTSFTIANSTKNMNRRYSAAHSFIPPGETEYPNKPMTEMINTKAEEHLVEKPTLDKPAVPYSFNYNNYSSEKSCFQAFRMDERPYNEIRDLPALHAAASGPKASDIETKDINLMHRRPSVILHTEQIRSPPLLTSEVSFATTSVTQSKNATTSLASYRPLPLLSPCEDQFINKLKTPPTKSSKVLTRKFPQSKKIHDLPLIASTPKSKLTTNMQYSKGKRSSKKSSDQLSKRTAYSDKTKELYDQINNFWLNKQTEQKIVQIPSLVNQQNGPKRHSSASSSYTIATTSSFPNNSLATSQKGYGTTVNNHNATVQVPFADQRRPKHCMPQVFSSPYISILSRSANVSYKPSPYINFNKNVSQNTATAMDCEILDLTKKTTEKEKFVSEITAIGISNTECLDLSMKKKGPSPDTSGLPCGIENITPPPSINECSIKNGSLGCITPSICKKFYTELIADKALQDIHPKDKSPHNIESSVNLSSPFTQLSHHHAVYSCFSTIHSTNHLGNSTMTDSHPRAKTFTSASVPQLWSSVIPPSEPVINSPSLAVHKTMSKTASFGPHKSITNTPSLNMYKGQSDQKQFSQNQTFPPQIYPYLYNAKHYSSYSK